MSERAWWRGHQAGLVPGTLGLLWACDLLFSCPLSWVVITSHPHSSGTGDQDEAGESQDSTHSKIQSSLKLRQDFI